MRSPEAGTRSIAVRPDTQGLCLKPHSAVSNSWADSPCSVYSSGVCSARRLLASRMSRSRRHHLGLKRGPLPRGPSVASWWVSPRRILRGCELRGDEKRFMKHVECAGIGYVIPEFYDIRHAEIGMPLVIRPSKPESPA